MHLMENIIHTKRNRKKVKGVPKKRPSNVENAKPASVTKSKISREFKDYDEEYQELDAHMN